MAERLGKADISAVAIPYGSTIILRVVSKATLITPSLSSADARGTLRPLSKGQPKLPQCTIQL